MADDATSATTTVPEQMARRISADDVREMMEQVLMPLPRRWWVFIGLATLVSLVEITYSSTDNASRRIFSFRT